MSRASLGEYNDLGDRWFIEFMALCAWPGTVHALAWDSPLTRRVVMTNKKKIQVPLQADDIASLCAGDGVLLSGTIYTARDQAHLRICEMIEAGEKLPVDLDGQVVYYCGPTPANARAIGSCGPTTSSRMDPFTPAFLEIGMKGMIGKGRRSTEVVAAVKKAKAVYFVAPGGAGAYLSERVKSCEVVAFADLGPEAIYELVVEDFPVVVAIDSEGNDLYAGLQN